MGNGDNNSWVASGLSCSAQWKRGLSVRFPRYMDDTFRFGSSHTATARGWVSRTSGDQGRDTLTITSISRRNDACAAIPSRLDTQVRSLCRAVCDLPPPEIASDILM